MINERVKGVALTYVLMVFRHGVSILIIPFIIANVGISAFGIYSLVASVIGYLVILELGLSTTTVRFLAKYHERNDADKEAIVLGNVYLLYILVCSFSIVIAAVLYTRIEGLFSRSMEAQEIVLLKHLYVVLFINVIVVFVTNPLTGLIISRERFAFLQGIEIAIFFFRVILVIGLLRMEFGVLAIAVIDTVLNLISAAAKLTYIRRRIPVKPRLSLDWIFFREISAYGFFVALNVVVNKINWRLAPLILGIVASPAAVAIYSVGLQFILAYMAIAAAITNVFLPKFVTLVERGADQKFLTGELVRIGRYQLILLGGFLVCYASAGSYLIEFMFGAEFELAFFASLIIMTCLTLVLMQGAANCIIQAKNRQKAKSMILFSVGICTAAAAIFLGRLYGVLGVAWATAGSLIAGEVLLMGAYLHLRVGIDMWMFYRNMAPILLLIILIIGVFDVLAIAVNDWVGLFLYLCLVFASYVVSIWLVILNKSDKLYLRAVSTQLATRALGKK